MEYSRISKLFHRQLLGNKKVGLLLFDLEKLIFGARVKQSARDNLHDVYIMSLARSGTTTLLNFLYSSDAFASLSYEDMPFLASPNIWLKIKESIGYKSNESLVERAHGDGISISSQAPEAFEEYVWKLLTDDICSSKEKVFREYVDLVCYRYQKKRYLSKNNQNIKRISFFEKGLIEGIYIHLIRYPISHVLSIMNQHVRFSQLQSSDKFILDYMRLVGHHEFGLSYIPLFKENLNFPCENDPNHWLEQWCFANENMINFTNKVNSSITVVLEKFSQDSLYRKKIMDRLLITGCDHQGIKQQKKHKPLLNMDKNLVKRALKIYEMAMQKCEY